MQILLFILILAAAGATLFVLVRGLVAMAQGGGDVHAVRSQALMQKRVTYQAIAIAFAILFILIGRS